MGAENSRPGTQRKGEDASDRAVAEALERQKRMYDEKYEELKKSQSKTVKVLLSEIKKRDQSHNNTGQQQVAHSSAVLYPNLNDIAIERTSLTNTGHNRQIKISNVSYASPSTSQCQNPLNTKLQVMPTAPPAPIEPAFEVQPVSAFKSAYKPHQIQSQARRPTAQALAGPSTSAEPVPSMSRPSTTQHPQQNDKRNASRYKEASNIVGCVTCSEELELQIYQCSNGHSSCRECRFKKTRCGACRELITDMRNFTLEMTIAELKIKKPEVENKMKCPNSADGCFLLIGKKKMEGHLKECPYRELVCPLAEISGVCTWKGKINQIRMHFKDVHPEHCEAEVDKEMYLLNIKVSHTIIHLVNISTFHFLVYIEINTGQKTISMTVQTLGTKFSASKWSYELHVYNKREPRRKYLYVDTCKSYSNSVSEVFAQGNCAVLSSDYAKTFLDNNNQLTYKFYIKKNFNPKKNPPSEL